MTPQDFGLSIIASWIANKISKNKKNENEDNSKLKEILFENKEKKEETETERLSKRFQKLFELMNQNRGQYNEFTIPKVSELLGLEKRSILENIVNGTDEPSFKFIKEFCEKFRISYKWLNEGKGEPFAFTYDYFSPMSYLDDIIKLNPEKIYFIQNKSKVAETFIMLGFSDWYYMVGTKTWHISNYVGASGQSQIYDLYRLIVALKENMFYTKCHGLKLDKEEFYDILLGRKFPGSCLNGKMGRRGDNPWWDDFTDVTNHYPISINYEGMHGKSFIDAQNIVKYKLNL